MYMMDMFAHYDTKPVVFTYEHASTGITIEGLVWNFAVLRWQIYFLYPWSDPKVIFLRKSAIDAGYTGTEKKKNQVDPV